MQTLSQGRDRRSCHRAQPVLKDGGLCKATLEIGNVSVQECDIVDISVGGALIRTDLELDTDMEVTLGGVEGFVVRKDRDGFAIRFDEESHYVKLEVHEAA